MIELRSKRIKFDRETNFLQQFAEMPFVEFEKLFLSYFRNSKVGKSFFLRKRIVFQTNKKTNEKKINFPVRFSNCLFQIIPAVRCSPRRAEREFSC